MRRIVNPIDREAMRAQVRRAEPFPFFSIDGFLTEDFALKVAESFPSFDQAQTLGREFKSVNERCKIQICDPSKFSEPIRQLNEVLASRDFLDTISYVMEIPNLLADEELDGGGIHETGPRGHLDVHVDFNYIEKRQLHRRLNILVYFNKDWQPEWGGNIELWDKEVKVCHHSFKPVLNRCVLFETNEISCHGVTAVTCPPGVSRKSFAAYYYTKEAPPHWTGESHSTIFKARPKEVVKGKVLMPLEKLKRRIRDRWRRAKTGVKKLVRPSGQE